MAKDYRYIYEKTLGIKLQPGIASIHHLDQNHSNHCFTNLVAIPQLLHNDLNLTFAKIKKTANSILKAKCYWLIRTKTLREMSYHIDNYLQLRMYIDLRNVLQKQGLKRAIEIFGKEFVEEIIIVKE